MAAAASAEGSTLAQLSTMTTVVADTGVIEMIKKYKPTDATTNPSLIYKAAIMPEFKHFLDDAIAYAKANAGGDKALQTELCLDKLAVNFGVEILSHVEGVVSTEVDARLSFDTEANITRARRIIGLYKDAGIPKERVLIKLASTWEGLQAAKVLEAEGIHCNMTLMFAQCQAIVAADVGAYLVSPFVGRIRDWYIAKGEYSDDMGSEADPGVISVRKIWAYYKKHGFPTIVMGASFRNTGEITALAGCDRLTISPDLLEKLSADVGSSLPRPLNTDDAAFIEANAPGSDGPIHLDEAAFRWQLNEDPMATEKLAEGIRNFAKDLVKLEEFIDKAL
ncbi:hypothetical protein FNF27_05086 [Cafeteria roenbergensis]|uniref:Transaldolase n=1 Tax=Cafeteria roenbergensis TaxID=33653 RepID=A0A5A8CZ60_CAFRO|nr:hypothetical protein FNF31_05393 [Cafeteria roenbergensis]KAA0163287.1 hypothetical protein FNF28_04345 [Cafeteria roenbergensis]KAA0173446.1 hypothetical protein FNF27_05086 [Cafeteria roenbergensis]|mmetsp:Transcript_14453/g.54657  ORF Transcript_14453/g.54657 Transcript_14453/m.54657 type:complete len:336 (-) Transcript_14453:158-1165(-)